LACCDEKGFVELNPQMVAHLLGGKIEQVTDAIEYLCQPDDQSRTRTEDGRRLIREGQFIYRIVNHDKYRAMRNQEERRAYQRNWIRNKRHSKE
jgi:hypothetical protein